MKNRMKKFLLLLFSCTLFISCSEDDSPSASSDKNLLEFRILQEGITTEIKDRTVYIYFPSSQKEFSLSLEIKVSEKAKFEFIDEVSKANYLFTSGNKFDFGGEYSVLRVQAEDRTYQDYKLEIVQAEGFQSIRLEVYDTWDGKPIGSPIKIEGKIDDVNKQITFNVPMEYVSSFRRGAFLRTTYIGEKDYITVPNANDFWNFDLFKEIVIHDNKTGENLKYKVVILNTDAFIKEIELPLQNAFVKSASAWQAWSFDYIEGLGRNDLLVFALENEKLTNIKPVNLKTTPNSTFTPDANTALDFTKDVEYIGTSQAGSQHKIKIRVIKRKVLAHPHIGLQKVNMGERGEIEYTSVSPIVGGSLVNRKTGEEYRFETFTNKGAVWNNPKATIASFVMKDKLPNNANVYYIPRVTLENGDKVDVDIEFYAAY